MWWIFAAFGADVVWQHATLDSARDAPSELFGTPRQRAIQHVLSAAGDGSVVIRDPDPISYTDIRSLPDWALEALVPLAWDRSKHGPEKGLERDVWVDDQVVVARHWPDGHYELIRGPTRTTSLPMAPLDVKARMGARSFEGPFTEREVALLWGAFDRLDPIERALLRGTRYKRNPKRYSASPFGGGTAAFGNILGPPVAVFYSSMYEEDVVHGTGADPLAKGMWTTVHELAHGIEWAGYYRAMHAARAGDAAPGSNDCGKAFNRDDPVQKAFLEAAGPQRFTDYGFANESEAFADAFALYHLHPDFLELASPDTYDWFARGGHHAWMFEQRWADCLAQGAVVRPGEPRREP